MPPVEHHVDAPQTVKVSPTQGGMRARLFVHFGCDHAHERLRFLLETKIEELYVYVHNETLEVVKGVLADLSRSPSICADD